MLRSLLNFLAKPVPKRSRQMSESARRKREFFGCVVCLSYCRRRKRGEIQLHCFPFLRSSLLQFPLFSIVSISSLSPFFLPAITVGRQRKCKEEERHGKTKRGPLPAPARPLPFLWQLFKKNFHSPPSSLPFPPCLMGNYDFCAQGTKKRQNSPSAYMLDFCRGCPQVISTNE